MDNPGRSLYFGGSIHVDGIRAPDQEEEEEDEEENQKREAEIQGMLANAFDDLEDDESFAQQSSYNSFAFGNGGRDSVHYEDGQGGKHHIDMSHDNYENTRDSNDNVFAKFENNNDGRRDFVDRESYSESFRMQEQLAEGIRNRDGPDHADSSGSVTPWSDDSHEETSDRFAPLAYHETAYDPYQITGEEGHKVEAEHTDYKVDTHQEYSETSLIYGSQAADYQADKYKSLLEGYGQEKVTEEQYRSAETPHHQMKLLYEARGRELDRLTSELSKLKFESSRDIRVLQHQVNLVTSENESKNANINQLQTLLSEKEERIKSLIADMKDLQNKVNAKENENKRIYFELETAQSTISSLECQISELKAADTLTRNQKLHEDFVKKLKQGSSEEREMLLNKLQDSQTQAEQREQEVTRLREELRNLRATYDDTLVHKTETVTKLTVTNETLRKQYEDLMKSHDSQQVLELQIKVRSLEGAKEKLENQVCSLESELSRAKEEIDGYDTAMKLGILSEVMPGEDSMVQLGIRKALNYDDTIAGEGQKNTEKYTETQEKLKLKEELKRSLMSNKAKRDEINHLHDEMNGKQQQIRKLESDLKSAQTEIKELRNNVLKLELAQAESQEKGILETSDNGQLTTVSAENISLREELVLLHESLNGLEDSFKAVKDIIEGWEDNLPKLSQDMHNVYIKRIDKLIGIADLCCSSIKDTKKYQEVITSIQNENNSLHKKQALWEKQLGDIQIKMKVLEKMITSGKADSTNSSEYGHAVNVLQKLLNDFVQHAETLKNEMNSFQRNEMRLRDQLTKSKLQVVRLQKEVGDLTHDKEKVEKELSALGSMKDIEKKEALEDCQNTYMRFHEDAMKVLEAKMKREYENIADVLKGEVARLADELTDAKNMYINICGEKNDLENQLKRKMDENTEPLATPAVQSNSYSVSAHDSGVDTNSCKKNASNQGEQVYAKKIQELQNEIVSLKAASEEENKRLQLLKESLQMQFDQKLKTETEAARMEALTSHESLQKKCSTLEECNQILKDTCTSLEEELKRAREVNNNSEVCSKEIENCRYILERQRKQFEKQEEELRTRYEKEIGDFKNLLAQTKSVNLQDGETLSMYKKTLKEQEQEIKNVVEECERVKEKLERKEADSELEVQRLTDLILNLESEVKEQQEEKNYTRANFQKMIEDLQNDLVLVKQSLKISEDKVVALKDVDAKYKSMKQKFSKFQASSKEQITYYKGEISRLSTEYNQAKETLLERVGTFVEELKKKCVACIDNTVLMLQRVNSSQNPLSGVLTDLQTFSTELQTFSLHLS